MALMRSTTLTSQPQSFTGVNWANPITRGLRCAVSASLGGINLVTRLPLTTTAPTDVGPNKGEIAVKAGIYSQFAAGAQLTSELGPNYNQDCTALTICSQSTASNNGTTFGYTTGSLGTGFQVGLHGGSLNGPCIRLDSNIYASVDTGVSGYTLKRRVVLGVKRVSASTYDLWADGKKWAGNVAFTPDTAQGGGGGINLQFGNSASSIPSLGLYWDRELSDLEIRSILANPWQIFTPTAKRLWMPSEAGGGAFTPAITESATLADSTSQVASLSANNSESLPLADSQARVAGFALALTEAAALADAQDAVLGRAASIAEPIVLADTAASTKAITSSISEAMALADTESTGASFSVSLSESMPLADAPNASLAGNLNATQTEAAALSDSSTSAMAAATTISEAMALNHAQTAQYAATANLTEALSLLDVTNASLAGNFTATVTEAVLLSDNASNAAAISAAISESASFSHNQTAQYASLASATDGLSLGAVETSSSPGAYAVAATDAMAMDSTQISQASLSAALVDALTLVDGSSNAWMAYVAMVEALGLSNTQNGNTGIGVTASIAEAMALVHAQSAAFSASMSKSTWWAYSVAPSNLSYSIDITINA